MAIKRYILTHHPDPYTTDTIYFRTDSESVVRPDGSTAEDYFSADHSAKADLIPVGDGSSPQTLQEFVTEVKNELTNIQSSMNTITNTLNKPIRIPVLTSNPTDPEPGQIWMIKP